MATSVLQSDFTAGELSPSLSARVDLAKYNKGCRTLRNFLVQPHGGAVKRPGFQLLGALPGSAVLIEFVFNTDQTYCLVFGERWMRVVTHDGFIMHEGTPYQIATPYTLEQARQLSVAQSADVLFIACHGVPPTKLMRYGHADWRFETMTFSSPLPAPTWDTKTSTWVEYEPVQPPKPVVLPGGGVIGDSKPKVYRQVERSALVPNIEFINQARKSDGSHSNAQCVTPYTYYVSALNKVGKESSLSVGASITGPSSNNWQAGDFIALRWKAVSGAEEYRIYKSSFSGRPGYIATVKDCYYHDYNVASSISEGAPKYIDPFILQDAHGNTVHDYPGVVCLFEQRLVFASTPRRPQTIWMSKSGDYSNFATYTPITDDAPIEMTIASQEVSSAKWMVPLRSLMIGTPGMEWEISGQGDAAFSAKNRKAVPQSYWGSSLKRALIIGNVILHVSSSGSQVRNLQYDFGSDSYGGIDLSILAEHLLENHRIIDWTYQKNPDSIIWAVRSDGVLLGLTFQAEHQISAWHRHDTQGKFTAICAVPHGYDYSLFAVVERNGIHYLERMADRFLGGNQAKAVFLDCSQTYNGKPSKTFSGLEHLEGREVGIFADGAVQAPRKVQGGKVVLDAPASIATVGLLYTADVETMPVEVIGQHGSSVALKKYINVVDIFFRNSMGVKAGLSFEEGKLQKLIWRSNEPYGSPSAPFTGMKQVTMPNLAENSVTVCIRSELPTPVTVLAIVSKMQVNP